MAYGSSKIYSLSYQASNAIHEFIGSACSQEENSFYQVSRKCNDAAAVLNFVTGDYSQTKLVNAYNRLNFNGTDTVISDYMKTIGMHKENLHFDFTASTQPPKGASSFAQPLQNVYNSSGFTNQELNMLRATGSINHNGTVISMTRAEADAFIKQCQKQSSLLVKNSATWNATTRSEKVAGLRNVYDNALLSMSTSSNLSAIASAAKSDGYDAMQKQCRITANTLDRQISSMLGQDKNLAVKLRGAGIDITKPLNEARLNCALTIINNSKVSNPSLLAEAIRDRNELKCFTETGVINAGMATNEASVRHGKALVARTFLGDEMYATVRTAKIGLNVMKMGVKTTVAMTRAVNFGAANIDHEKYLKELRSLPEPLRKIKIKNDKFIRNENRLNRRKSRNIKRTPKTKFDRQRQARLNRKYERQLARNARRHMRFKNSLESAPFYKKAAQRIKGTTRRITNFVFAPLRIFTDPAKFLLNSFNSIKKYIIQSILIPIGAVYAKIMGVSILFTFIIFIILHFISNPLVTIKNAAGEMQKKLEEANYMQYIVDIVADDLATNFVEVAKKDATLNYLNVEADSTDSNGGIFQIFRNPITSKEAAQANGANKADVDFASNITKKWYVMPEYGEIANIWVWEESDDMTKWKKDSADGKFLAGSLVFDKGLIDSEEYKGYVPVRQRQSISGVNDNMVPIVCMMHHRFMSDIDYHNWENALGYAYYMFVNSHDIACHDSKLEKTTVDGIIYPDVKGDTEKLGYSYTYKDACARESLYGTKPCWDGGGNGGHVEHRDTEVCTNIYVHGDDTRLSSSASDARRVGTKLFSGYEEYFKKTIYQHYTSSLHTFFTAKPADVDGGSPGYYVVDSTCDESPSQVSATASLNGGVLDTGSEGKCTHFSIEQYGGDYLKCDITAHTDGCRDKNGVLICTNPKHDDSHVHEFKTTDDSCYVRVCVCQGHCGGHLTPQVNIIQKMTYEGLALDDNFICNHNLTKNDIINGYTFDTMSNVRKLIENHGLYHIKDWKNYWSLRFAEWYLPFPLGGLNRAPFWESNIKSAGYALIDFVAGNSDKSEEGEKDIYDFEGWWKDTNVYNTVEMGLLNSIYGSYYKPNGIKNDRADTKYQMAIDMWSSKINAEDYAINFVLGSGAKTLSEAEIEAIIAALRPINERREAILRLALSMIGKYTYKLGGKDINGSALDCSGFVTAVLNAVLPEGQSPLSAAGYAAKGTPCTGKLDVIPPGAVVAHSQGGSGYTGHVMFYLGYMENGPEGPGYYTCESTTTKGGPSGPQIKKRSEKYLNKCNFYLP